MPGEGWLCPGTPLNSGAVKAVCRGVAGAEHAAADPLLPGADTCPCPWLCTPTGDPLNPGPWLPTPMHQQLRPVHPLKSTIYLLPITTPRTHAELACILVPAQRYLEAFFGLKVKKLPAASVQWCLPPALAVCL